MDTAIMRIFNTDGPRVRADDGRAVPTFVRQALGWSPQVDLADGLRRTIDWIRADLERESRWAG